MTTKLEQLFDLAIILQEKIGKLYSLFSDIFPEDTILWRQLSKEENNHACIIEDAKDALFNTGFSTTEIIPKDIDRLKLSINKVDKLLEYYAKHNSPEDRKKAFKDAMSIEESPGESDYEMAMTKKTISPSLVMLQESNKEDKLHAKRISEYADKIV
ncbi:MAG: hypothetical protein GY756_24940 [bacterium]|nr:hypothetical protein [bacterium]